MRRSTFKRPKMVLIFNGAQVLVAVTRSLHSAAELTKGNLQAISFCCTGNEAVTGQRTELLPLASSERIRSRHCRGIQKGNSV